MTLSNALQRRLVRVAANTPLCATNYKLLTMNNSKNEKQQNPPLPSPVYRVGDNAYDKDWKELNVSNKKGWRCVKVGKDWVGLSSLPDKTGDNDPVYWGYVMGGWGKGANYYYDKLLNNT